MSEQSDTDNGKEATCRWWKSALKSFCGLNLMKHKPKKRSQIRKKHFKIDASDRTQVYILMLQVLGVCTPINVDFCSFLFIKSQQNGIVEQKVYLLI